MIPAQGTPFVVFGDDWDRVPSTMQHIFRHIATRYPVVWVNGIGHRVPRLTQTDIKRAWEKFLRVFQSHAETPAARPTLGGTVPQAIIEPKVLPWHHVPVIHRFNTRSLVRAITHRLDALQAGRRPILVTGSPPSAGVLGKLGESASVYFCQDDYLNFPTYTASMLAPLEQRLLDQVDLFVGTAASLTRSKVPRSGRAYHLPQGVNYEHFAHPRAEPPDLAGIPRPRIGFAGSVSTQCDVMLLSRLATTFPNASLVLVGPVSLDASALEHLRHANVRLLGLRRYEDLPSYVQHFDVGIIPYLLSAWTVAVDPLKLLEYLAAGLPVVTTQIPEVMKYAGSVAVAADADAFIAAVAEALTHDRNVTRAKGQAVASTHTWERRADTLLELIRGVLVDKAERESAFPARPAPSG